MNAKWLVSAALLVALALPARALWMEVQLTPKTLDQHTLGFSIRSDEKEGMAQFTVTISPKAHKISPVTTLRVRIMDGDTEIATVPLEERRENGKVTCWFRIAPRLLLKSRFEFGEHGYGQMKDGERPLVDEWGRRQYVGLPGGVGYWFLLTDFAPPRPSPKPAQP